MTGWTLDPQWKCIEQTICVPKNCRRTFGKWQFPPGALWHQAIGTHWVTRILLPCKRNLLQQVRWVRQWPKCQKIALLQILGWTNSERGCQLLVSECDQVQPPRRRICPDPNLASHWRALSETRPSGRCRDVLHWGPPSVSPLLPDPIPARCHPPVSRRVGGGEDLPAELALDLPKALSQPSVAWPAPLEAW